MKTDATETFKMFYEADAARAQAAAAHDAANSWANSWDSWGPALDPVSVSLADRQLVVVAAAHDEVVLAPESELETLHRLAEKHGMVLMQAPSETVLTEAVDPEPVNTTPRGLTMVAAMGGVRMGCAAWQRD